MSEVEALVVVGAGFAGLAAAAAARALGVEPLVLDRAAAPGGAWARMPPGMVCLSPRHRDRLPDGTTPAGSGPRATAAEVHAAVARYAERSAFRVSFGVEVRRCTRDAAGDGALVLDTSRGPVRARRLVVATGEHARPHVPSLRGAFGGRVEHSSAASPASARAGERVVVVGAGNSGAETALAFAAAGASVTIAARSPVRGTRELPALPGLDALAWWLSGLRVARLPARGGCEERTPLQGLELARAVRAGRVRLVDEAVAVGALEVVTRAGTAVPADRVVFATGFSRDTTFLGELLTLDERGAPEAHREGIAAEERAIGFVGLPCMRTRRSGFLRGFTEDARAVVGELLRRC